MQENFTEIIANEVESYPVDYCDDECYLDEIDFLNNNLRTFGSGLSELMRKCGYNGGDDPSEKSYHLCRALKKIGADISAETVDKWFSDTARPKVQGDSRERMFWICFALKADAEKTEWFFHHVYFDRCFDCRQLKEAVYLFCMKNGRTYEQALSLYEKVRGFTDIPEENDQNVCYTAFMNKDIRELSSEEEFIEYVRRNPHNFKMKNKKILEQINLYMSELSHPAADRAAANFIRDKKNKNAYARKIPKECGLILRWLYEVNSYDMFMDMLYKRGSDTQTV